MNNYKIRIKEIDGQGKLSAGDARILILDSDKITLDNFPFDWRGTNTIDTLNHFNEKTEWANNYAKGITDSDAPVRSEEEYDVLKNVKNRLKEIGVYNGYNPKLAAQKKLNKIIQDTFLNLTDEDHKYGITVEKKKAYYEKCYRPKVDPMVDEIMAEIGSGNKEVMAIVQNYDLNHESVKNKVLVEDKLLPEMYEKVQDRIKKEYEEKKIPYVVMYSSGSPEFPLKNKVYTVKEFNEILLQADSEFHNRKKYAEEKYGSAENYWDLERDDELPEEDKGIRFVYYTTNFKFFNIPNPNNPEDTFRYEPNHYDIGAGNGSVFDFVRSTCSHDDFIEALNALETQLYFPGVTDSQRQFVEKTVKKETQVLKATLKEKMEVLDKAHRVDEILNFDFEGIKDAYDSSMNDVFTKVLNEYPFASGDVAGSEFLKYTANEAKKMAVSELYLPRRKAQKIMDAEDIIPYNFLEKHRLLWEKFPANVNMTSYTEKLLQDKCNENRIEKKEEQLNLKKANVKPFLNEIDADSEELALVNKENGDYLIIHKSNEHGWDYTAYDEDYREIDGGISGDSEKNIREITKSFIVDLYPESDYPEWETTDIEEVRSKVEEQLNQEKIKIQVTNLENTKKKYEKNVEKTLAADPKTYKNVLDKKITEGLTNEQITNIVNVVKVMAENFNRQNENSNYKNNQNTSSKGRK